MPKVNLEKRVYELEQERLLLWHFIRETAQAVNEGRVIIK